MTDNITADAAFAEINKTHAIVLHNCRCMVFIQSCDSNHQAKKELARCKK